MVGEFFLNPLIKGKLYTHNGILTKFYLRNYVIKKNVALLHKVYKV